jgi:lipoprotein-anchoring transpeptidase ErfK/SrfK
MDDQNKYQPWHCTLVVLSFSLLSFSPMALATTDYSSQPEASIINSNHASSNKFVFSPRTLQWQAINADGHVVRSGHGSGGRGYCPDIKRSCRTPSGTYTVFAKNGPNCHSSRYPVGKGGAPMPYCMFFSKYYAIHGSPDVPNRNASHGCIRVVPSDARWLNQNFVHIGTKVVVKPY